MGKIKTVILNEKKMSLSEFKRTKTQLESKPGVKVIQLSEGIYKTEIRG